MFFDREFTIITASNVGCRFQASRLCGRLSGCLGRDRPKRKLLSKLSFALSLVEGLITAAAFQAILKASFFNRKEKSEFFPSALHLLSGFP